MDRIKILAITDESGSKYHRIRLPLELISLDQVECRLIKFGQMKKEDLEWCDIFFFNGIIDLMPHNLSLLRAQYGFKIIMDVDDFWELPEVFPDRKSIMESKKYRIDQMIIADCIFTTTERLAQHIINSEYNENVHVIPNRIPFGYGQFVGKPNQSLEMLKSRNDTIHVGICGSLSHYTDYKLLITAMNKISKDKELRNKIKFVIAGYDDRSSSDWKQIINIFNGMDSVALLHKSADNYMELYDDIDILLAPLVDNEFNSCKSDLKLQEALCKGINVISTGMYFHAINSLIKYDMVFKTDDWINGIKNYKSTFKSSIAYPYSTFADENDKRLFYFRDTLSFKKPQPEDIKIFSVIYKTSQITEYPKVLNDIQTKERKSYLFEYNPMISILQNGTYNDDDFIGIFSHKFSHKTLMSRHVLLRELEQRAYWNYDVIGLCDQNKKFIKKKRYYRYSEIVHPGFMELFEKICQELKLSIQEPKKIVYSNFFIAKYSFWKEYVIIIKKAIELMEGPYRDLAWKDSNYKSGLQQPELHKQTGLDYYPMHTFILERLLSAYLTTHPEVKFDQLLIK